MRQLLADTISGNQVGLWLLLPEHLRRGTWDLLCAWTGAAPGTVEPRLALPLVHKAALCTCSLRQGRFQIALGKLRRASGHFGGQLLAIDPHRLQSYTQRQTRRHPFSFEE